MFELPFDLIVCFAAFSIFLFYQQRHAVELQYGRAPLETFLTCSAGTAAVFDVATLLYFGFAESWWKAGKLLATWAIIVSMSAIAIELVLARAVPVLPYGLSVLGFVALPVLGYGIVRALP